MSAFSDRTFGLRRAAATVAHRPGRFLLSVLLGTTALATLLLLIAMAYTASIWAARVQAGPEVSLFVTPGTAPRELDELRARLAALPDVNAVRVIPRDQAYAELSKRSGLNLGSSDSRPNPLPDVLVARFALTVDPAAVDRAAAAARTWPGVDAIQADVEWYRRVVTLLRASSGLVAVGSVLAALLIGLALLGAALPTAPLRRDETAVLDLVGARPSFIVRPYAYASAIAVGFAAILALAAVAAGLALAEPRIAAGTAVYGHTFRWPDPPLWFPAAFVVTAVLLGWMVGWFAARIQLRQMQYSL